MNHSKAWYSIVINCTNHTWFDYNGLPITTLVLDKQYRLGHTTTHYTIKSFGTLLRKMGEIPDSPIQELSDWTITMDSVYSDGDFQTMDLLYYLESINRDFNLVGCEARLLQLEGNSIPVTIFRCSVVAVSSGNGIISITFSESIGAPVIAKKSAPIPFGGISSEDFWPVKMTKNTFGMDEIILSERTYTSSGEIFMYLENKKYVQVSIRNSVVSEGNTRMTFRDGISFLTEYVARPGAAFLLSNLTVDKIRQDTDPVNCIAGDEWSEENVQIWTNQSMPTPEISGDFMVSLARDLDVNKQRHHEPQELLKTYTKPRTIVLYLHNARPISISESKDPNASGGFRAVYCPCVSGNPALLFEPENTNREDYPKVSFGEAIQKKIPATTKSHSHIVTNSVLSLKFSEEGIPSDAIVTDMYSDIHFQIHGYYFSFDVKLGNRKKSLESSSKYYNRHDWDLTRSCDFDRDLPLPLSETQLWQFVLRLGRTTQYKYWTDSKEDYFSLRDFRVTRKVEIPFTDNVKLYTNGIGEPAASNGSNFVIPAIESLLDAAGIRDFYEVDKDGDLGNVSVNSIMTDESAEFRVKLKTLAIASSTFIKFDSASNTFIASSLERSRKKISTEIPFKCFILENNIYSFSMQTPMKDQVYSGLEISYGKNIATGKYEHRILVNESGVSHDGENYPIPLTDEDLKWHNLQGMLGKNSGNGINNLKSIENEWIKDKEGAERAAYTYLSWCCSPIRTAQIKCFAPLLSELASCVDIGEFVWFVLPGYPEEKMKETSWMVTAIAHNLDSNIVTLSLLEKWNDHIPLEGYILTEKDRNYINTENEQHIKLEE